MNSTYSRLKQIYLGIIPIYPLGYVLVHGFRGDQIWAKVYVNRSNVEPSEKLKELVEHEIDKIDNLKKAKFRVALTDDMDPKVYGGLFLTNGAELQFPLRMTLEDLETARRMGANLEVDLGLSKHRRKVEVRSDTGDELVSRLMLSDAAKRFLVQRQLQIANSGEYFCAPIFAWIGLSTVGYGFLNGVSMFGGPWLGMVTAVGFTIGGFKQFLNFFEGYKTRRADETVVRRGDEYVAGAVDYFTSSMKLNRLFRRVMGAEGELRISKNGDLSTDPVLLSERIRSVRRIGKEMKKSTQNSKQDVLDDN